MQCAPVPWCDPGKYTHSGYIQGLPQTRNIVTILFLTTLGQGPVKLCRQRLPCDHTENESDEGERRHSRGKTCRMYPPRPNLSTVRTTVFHYCISAAFLLMSTATACSRRIKHFRVLRHTAASKDRSMESNCSARLLGGEMDCSTLPRTRGVKRW